MMRSVAGAPPFDACTDGGNCSRNFETGNVARARWRWIGAATLQDVRTIHARGGDANEHLAWSGHRIRTFSRLENLRLTRL